MTPPAVNEGGPAPGRRLRVALVGNYSPAGILPDDHIHPRHVASDHPASWIRALGIGLSRQPDIEVRLFVHRRSVVKPARVCFDGIDIEFVPQVWPARTDHLLLMIHNAIRLYPYIRSFQPNLVHGFGFETGNALLVSHLPWKCTAFVQGIVEGIGRQRLGLSAMEFYLRLLEERWAGRRVAGVVVESQYAEAWAKRRCRRAIVSLIPHAVNPEFLESPAAPVAQNPPVFVFVGSLVLRKGVDLILRAAKMCRRCATFIIIGDGPDRTHFEQMAVALGCEDRIRFVGSKRRPDIVRALHSARGFVFPSRADTSPNAITEAQAVGLPVIATRVGGIPDMIADGEDGFLVEPEDCARLAERVDQLTVMPQVAAEMGLRGWQRVRRLHTPEKVAQAHIAFFRQVLAK